MDWLIVVVAAVISGLLGVAVSLIYYRKHEEYLRKLQILRDFTVYRYDIAGDNFTRAINAIFFEFSDSARVKQAFTKYYENSTSTPVDATLADKYILELFNSMCDELKIKTSDFTDSFFLTAFNVKRRTTPGKLV